MIFYDIDLVDIQRITLQIVNELTFTGEDSNPPWSPFSKGGKFKFPSLAKRG
jgi:hypothetical protein